MDLDLENNYSCKFGIVIEICRYGHELMYKCCIFKHPLLIFKERIMCTFANQENP